MFGAESSGQIIRGLHGMNRGFDLDPSAVVGGAGRAAAACDGVLCVCRAVAKNHRAGHVSDLVHLR